METEKKLIPYSVYLPKEHVDKIKELAKQRKASELIRDAIINMIEHKDMFKSGYNKGLKDAADAIYECKEAQMIAIEGKDLGVILSDQIKNLEMK
jgi:metal-responsive CopG/Arc/MetJ family transcriptional regulator